MRALMTLAIVTFFTWTAHAQEFARHHLVVADSILSIHEYDPANQFVRAIGPENQLRGLAFGPDGRLYAADFNTDRILVFDGDANKVDTWGAGTNLDGPWGLAFGPNGLLYVTSVQTDTVIVFDTDGDVAFEFGDPAFDLLRYLAFSPDHRLFITDTGAAKVFEFELDGTFVREFETALGAAEGIVVGGDGRLYAASATRVNVYTLEGDQVDDIGTATGLSQPHGLTIGPNGNLFVASFGTGSIFEFDIATGAVVDEFGDTGANPLNQVHGIAFAPTRARAKVKATVYETGDPRSKEKVSGVFSFFLGTGTTMLQLDGGEGPFGSDSIVIQGLEATDDLGKKTGYFGSQRVLPTTVGGDFTIQLELATKAVNGDVLIKRAIGTASGGVAGAVFGAKVTATPPIN